MQSSVNNLLSVVVALSLVIISGMVCAEETLCESKDKTYFSCQMRSGKIASLCSIKGDGKEESLVYKFGTRKHIELSFSSDIGGDGEFMVNHYIRNRVDYLTISFYSRNYRYSLFRNYDENISQTADFGVSIEDMLHPSKEKIIPCAVVGTDRLSEAAKGLRCDPESALGCYNVPPSHVPTPTEAR